MLFASDIMLAMCFPSSVIRFDMKANGKQHVKHPASEVMLSISFPNPIIRIDAKKKREQHLILFA